MSPARTATYGHPGIYVTESLAGPQPPALTISPSQAAFMGEHWRGPTGYAVQCNSWSDFVKFFGGFNAGTTPVLANPYLAYEVYEYYANGGATCWIARVIASLTPGATASCTLFDNSTTTQATLTAQAGILGVAGNPGTWGNSLYVGITASPTSGRFNLQVYYGGNTAPYIVESWTDLSMQKTDSRYAPNVINSPTGGSIYIVIADSNSVAAFPNNMPNVGITQLSGGIDPADPTSNDYVTSLSYGNQASGVPTSPFDAVNGVLNFNLPGNVTPTVITAAIAYAAARPQSFVVLDSPSGLTPAGAVSYFGATLGNPVSSYAAAYYPWLNAINPAQSNLQQTILLPPGGFVLGQMDAIDSNFGVWVAPAGLNTVLQNVVKAERTFAPTDLDTLNTNNVNAIKTRPNGQVVIWGTRTLQSGYASLYVPIRRFLNYVEAALTQLLEFAVFQPNDFVLWGNVTAVCTSFLNGLYGQGAFPGTTPPLSYYVLCNATNNPQSSVSQGILNVQVGLALLYPAEFIALNIAQFQPSGTTVITTSNA